MREYLISAVRHFVGAAAGAAAAFLLSRGFVVLAPEDVEQFAAGLQALAVGFSLAAYAAVEKLLKPVAERLFGSPGL